MVGMSGFPAKEQRARDARDYFKAIWKAAADLSGHGLFHFHLTGFAPDFQGAKQQLFFSRILEGADPMPKGNASALHQISPIALKAATAARW